MTKGLGRRELDANRWVLATPLSSFGPSDASRTARQETARRHALENYEKDLNVVQELEMKLGVSKRWQPQDAEWQQAGQLVARCKYQRALDHLEGLVVARIFELSKMNWAGTGVDSSNCHTLITDTTPARVQAVQAHWEGTTSTLGSHQDGPRSLQHYCACTLSSPPNSQLGRSC